MANTRRHFAAMFVAVLGVAQLAVAGTAYAQQRRMQPAETLLMYGVQTTPEISATCEAWIDKSFGRGKGAEVHRSAGLAACIQRGGM